MSNESTTMNHDAPMTKINTTFATLGGVCLVAGGGALAAGLSGGFDLKTLGPSFLYGLMFWLLLTVGCFGLMLLFHTTRGRWGTPILRVFEAGSNPIMMIFMFALVMIAATIFKDPLYGKWINASPMDLIVQRKAAYLNYNFFLVRQVIYFVVLALIGHLLITWTKREEATGDKTWSDKRNNLAAPGLVIFFLIFTFMITDVLMSVDPHWYSTVWGVLFAVGGALGAMALATIIAVSQRNKAPYAGKIDNLMTKDFGNFLLMLTMLWAYLSFSQLLIIWSGNLKEFIPYYLARIRGGWSTIGGVLIVTQFLLPFLLLLSPRLKRTPSLLITICIVILASRVLDMHWLVSPYFNINFAPTLSDVGFLLAIGGLWMLIFSAGLKSSKLVVESHPYETFSGKEAEAHV